MADTLVVRNVLNIKWFLMTALSQDEHGPHYCGISTPSTFSHWSAPDVTISEDKKDKREMTVSLVPLWFFYARPLYQRKQTCFARIVWNFMLQITAFIRNV